MKTPDKIYIRAVSEKQERFVAYSNLYNQDEQDIEYIRSDLSKLTAGDIMDISNIAEDIESIRESMTQKRYCEEIARRFNEQKWGQYEM